jgi:hypothetical protein
LIVIDEVGYVPLAEVGAEFLFQVVAERAEKAAAILTTNLPFSEWTTGTESYRFRRTAENRRREPRGTDRSQAMEMTVRGKLGKPNPGFPPFPALGNRSAIPTFQPLVRLPPISIGEARNSLSQRINDLGWAKINRRSGPNVLAKRMSR